MPYDAARAPRPIAKNGDGGAFAGHASGWWALAASVSGGLDNVASGTRTSVAGGAMNTAFRQERYHTPFDDVDQDFDYEAGADHARINFLTGYIIAQEDERPTWNAGDFFGDLFGR